MLWLGPLLRAPFTAWAPSGPPPVKGLAYRGGTVGKEAEGSGSSATGASVDGPQIISLIGSEGGLGPQVTAVPVQSGSPQGLHSEPAAISHSQPVLIPR